MVVRKQKKVRKQRGSRTHGWGLVHRGSGQRGGFGNAGRGKKSHCKKPQVWKERYLGKDGFIKHGQKEIINIISIKQIEQQLPLWTANKIAVEEKDVINIDLTKLGYTKLLSTGHVTKKMNITVKNSTSAAVEKIKAAGGKVTNSAQ